jgi:heme A synthase
MTMVVRWLAAITAVLVLIQAALIGQVIGLGDLAKQTLHGTLGSVTFVAALILTALAFLAMRRAEASSAILILAIVVTLLLVVQLGLGYMGRRDGLAAALHVPNGVLIAGLLCALLTATFAAPRRAGQLHA